MSAETGKLLAHYRLSGRLGAGGMGEVWEAADTRLDRQVAVKLLPPAFASDPDRLARFEREAKLLAAVNHPNIGAIYGVEQADDVRFLVLELVPGDTLAERLARSPLPPEEALAVARQIAEALEAAHDQGILHRDLKPANVKITPEGRVKVLDFGLAKTVTPDPSSSSVSLSPTVTVAGTQQGVILGTAPYMSPEQARGKAVDRRADVWAFGCVLYECLAGHQAFAGETVTDVLGAILHREPDWNLLPPGTPARAVRLLHRCLQKDPRQRLHDIADARIVLEEGEAAAPHPAAAPPHPGRWMAPAAAAIVLAGVAFVAGRRLGPTVAAEAPRPSARFVVDVAPAAGAGEATLDLERPAVTLSPDGRRLAYVLRAATGDGSISVRELDRVEPEPLRGGEGAEQPFFSPDGEQIAFFADHRLRSVPTGGGTAVDLSSVGNPRRGAWVDGIIYYTPGPDAGIWRVPAGGGAAQELTRPDPDKGERTHRWPCVLPGGKGLLLTVGNSKIRSFDDASIAVYSLETGELRLLFDGGTDARYLPPGGIVYYRAGTLYAVPFDPVSLKIAGRPEAVQEGVVGNPLTGGAQYALSDQGTLAFIRGKPSSDPREVVRVTADGKLAPLSHHQGEFSAVAASPDGRELALTQDGANSDIWLLDLERDALSRLTFEWNNLDPVWTPDGKRVVYSRGRGGLLDLFWTPVDGSAPPEALYASARPKTPTSFSADGSHLAFTQSEPDSGADVWVLSMADHSAAPFLHTSFNEEGAAFSPDGRWLAYVSDESGRREIYVRPYPGPGGKWQVSVDGGFFAKFSADGRRIYFVSDAGVMVADVDTSSGFRTGRARVAIRAPAEPVQSGDLLPDGTAVAIRPVGTRPSAHEIEVVLNWRPLASGEAAGGR